MTRATTVTQTTIEALLAPKARPTKDQNIVVVLGGLDLVVGTQGPGRWRYRYRPHGIDPETGRRYPQRSLTIGTTQTHSLREASLVTAGLKLRVSKGEDPAHADRAAVMLARAKDVDDERQARAAEAARVTCRMTLDAYCDKLATHGRSAKHQREELAQVRLGLDSIGIMDAAPSDVTARHVEKMMAACPPLSRALRFGALDRFMRWAVRGAGTGGAAPTASLDKHERPKPPAPRQRVLMASEVAAIWSATANQRTTVLRDLVRFLITTPCREGEAAGATWGDIDLAARVWTQPTSKNGRPHRFPLNDRAVAVLMDRRAAATNKTAGDLVFPAPRSGKVFGGWSNLKEALDTRTRAAVKPWRLHDLRRTAATALGDAGYDDALIDMLLNHTAAGTRSVLTRTYNVAQRWDERTRSVAAWDRWIGAALGEPETSAAVATLGEPRRKVA